MKKLGSPFRVTFEIPDRREEKVNGSKFRLLAYG